MKLGGEDLKTYFMLWLLSFADLFAAPTVAFTNKKISVQGTLDNVDLNVIGIEANYTGPKLQNEKITLQFMEDLIKFYNETKYQDKKNILHRKFVFMILKQARSYFKRQPSLIEVKLKSKDKMTICGNIHGKLEDLLHIFDINGLPSANDRYLFNGDFVNRRAESIECALIIFGFSLLYPDTLFIGRGDHEAIEQCFGKGCLEEELHRKYPGNQELLRGFWEVFQWLPLAYVISSDVHATSQSSSLGRPLDWGRKMYNRVVGRPPDHPGAYGPTFGRVLVVHGGLFTARNVTLEDIRKIERGCDPIDAGQKSLMFDLLWSNPGPKAGRRPNRVGYLSIQFGADVSESFCIRNGIDYILRSHVPLIDGYHVDHDGRVVTIFSTSDYQNDNKGAIAVLKAPELKPYFTTYLFRYDQYTAKCFWVDEKDIPVGKYNTTGLEPSENEPSC